ncbi:nucleoside hydrolase [Micromonospora auratinigra]|uniref:Purine nucleosidase n=1 Tax=Micromonospora auratinigra TaxID=261654 RepID=A0A1A8Z999_9ACTN|nr:nucleoside hydrolase [Micromonospora auratinigra]SBT40535.1 purine nucleosidase [Micromonospora auratinigra]
MSAAPTPQRPLRVIIDTDPGLGAPGADIDDGLAIALALASPELIVEGLTIVNGNVDTTAGTANALALLERLGRTDVPVFVGAGAPLRRDMAPVHELFARVLPDAGVPTARPVTRPRPEHAAVWLADTVLAAPGEITVLAIGPMTNLALALALRPEMAGAVREFVIMAGAATTYAQNITPVGDFNAYVDPEALDVVLRSGAPVRMVGLDQTMRVRLTRAHAARMREVGSPFALWAADCTDAWISFLHAAFPSRPEHVDGCFLHDPLTVAAVLRPDLVRFEPAHVQVEMGSELCRGLVVADRGLSLTPPAGPPNAAVAVDTEVDAFVEFFLDRLLAAAPSVETPASDRS